MKTWILIALCIIPVAVRCQEQATLTVFSADGQPFYLYVDGLRQNETARKEVKVIGLTRLFCQVKVEFTDAAHTSVTRNRVSVSDGEDNLVHVTYRVIKQGNSARLRFYSMNTNGVTKTVPVAVKPAQDAMPDMQPTASLTVFSEQGDNFFLYVNGVQQNSVAQSRIRVEGLPDLFCQVKMVFADPKIPSVSRSSLSVSDGDDQLMDTEYKLMRTGSSSRLRFYSMNPATRHPAIQPGTYVYTWGQAVSSAMVKPAEPKTEPPKPVASAAPAEISRVNEPKPVIKPVTEPVKPAGDNKTQVPVTTKPINPEPQQAIVRQPEKPTANEPVKTESRNTALDEPADWVCANEWPMWKVEYNKALKSIEAAASEEEKYALTQKLLATNCFNTDQVVEIARLLSKEDNRVQWIQSAFSHTIDYKNYMRVMLVIQMESNKVKLNRFLHRTP